MIKFYATLLSAALALAGANAATLSPEQALAAAMKKSSRMCAKSPDRNLRLAFTLGNKAQTAPALYVFNSDNNGFVVVSASDATESLLAYSDSGAFDPDNISPAQRWWLNEYASQIEWAQNNPYEAAEVADLPGRKAVAPLCSTTWAQEAPYNNLCPVLSGYHAMTGCVATAMSQIMKSHNYPSRGTGSKSYTYPYNGRNYSESANFGSTTYQWSSMLNSYSGGYSSAQASAVATLMHDCGVAAEMRYDPYGSGASELVAGAGMISYFGYDKAMTWESRAWYSLNDWNELLYKEMEAGRAVLYGGVDRIEGHEFVCDGYSSDNYFHINWGWSGTGNGYYLLSALKPTAYPGGAYTGGGYNYDQSAVIGIQPAKFGSDYVVAMYCASNFGVDRNSVTTTSNSTITFLGGAWSASLFTANFSVGLRCVFDDGSETYVTYRSGQLAPNNGYESMPFYTNRLARGTYDAYPACSLDGKTWYNLRVPAGSPDHVRLRSGSSTIAIYNGRPIIQDVEFVNSPYDGTDPNHPAIVSYTDPLIKATIGASGSWSDTVFAAFYELDDDDFSFYDGADININLSSGRSTTVTLVSTDLFDDFSYDFKPEGIYRFAIYGKESGSRISQFYYIKVTDNSGVGSISSDNNAPVDYFNLQGQRVAEPKRGQYVIRRQGTQSQKIRF